MAGIREEYAMSVSGPTLAPHELIWGITNSVVAARALHLVAALRVADHIDAEVVSAEDLAALVGVDAGALDRVLGLLVTQGVFARHGGGYVHTDASQLLRSDHPMSMSGFARMMALPVMWSAMTNMDHSVRTGAPALELTDPNGLWGYLQSHPEDAGVFGEAMMAKAQADIAAIVGSYDFGGFATIADIGGGRGHLLQALLEAHPSAAGILFDLPGVIDTLESAPPRLTRTGGDFFADPLPRAEAYVLMEVLHDWDDQEAAAILAAVHDAAPAGATLLIIENVMGADSVDARGHILDVIMLTFTGGRERTADQFDMLLANAGFRPHSVIETASPMRIVEATAV
jgi:C-methyltransferase